MLKNNPLLAPPLLLTYLLLGLSLLGITLMHRAATDPSWFRLTTTLNPSQSLLKTLLEMRIVVKFGLDLVCSAVNEGREFCMDPPPCGPLCARWAAARTLSWIIRAAFYLAFLFLLWLALRLHSHIKSHRASVTPSASTAKPTPTPSLPTWLPFRLSLGAFGVATATAVCLAAVAASIKKDLNADAAEFVNVPAVPTVVTREPEVALDVGVWVVVGMVAVGVGGLMGVVALVGAVAREVREVRA
ncbi:hypothetical protein HDU96_006679 [Phlyctochytrium bullatum]|nr:hypothetical protein HDU96_006679 [Phlyctochytrium bullatum]